MPSRKGSPRGREHAVTLAATASVRRSPRPRVGAQVGSLGCFFPPEQRRSSFEAVGKSCCWASAALGSREAAREGPVRLFALLSHCRGRAGWPGAPAAPSAGEGRQDAAVSRASGRSRQLRWALPVASPCERSRLRRRSWDRAGGVAFPGGPPWHTETQFSNTNDNMLRGSPRSTPAPTPTPRKSMPAALAKPLKSAGEEEEDGRTSRLTLGLGRTLRTGVRGGTERERRLLSCRWGRAQSAGPGAPFRSRLGVAPLRKARLVHVGQHHPWTPV